MIETPRESPWLLPSKGTNNPMIQTQMDINDWTPLIASGQPLTQPRPCSERLARGSKLTLTVPLQSE